ncbi:UDP-glycosyltransferase [Wenyingzhuangia sp. chi5]|uniref:UDP-glycosyltransferase n=1 Tax=Wenyingzhuangia gilva TaxID=3057677 RepID=A0ABT8VT38_9FLAO|nr:UDP-glycosyltransferase [Wenyingzhuangia sp. chi5]MDO3695123.1 UDP-glycosyltransferase [Wenyingzhuangia sp. chi5]
MKNILIISESIDIEDSSGSKVNVALIQNLKKIGYQIKVLHYTRKNIQLGNEIECIAIPEIKFSLNYILSRTQRVFQRITKLNVSKFLENIFGHSFTFFNDSRSITKAVNKNYCEEDLIITLSKGASFRPHHAMLRLPNLHSKWMAYVHDPYPFHFYPRPYNWVEAGYQYKEDFFRKVSEQAKYSAFPSLLLKEWMGSYFPNFLKTGVIIPHQNLEVEIKNSEINLPNYLDTNKFNLLHAGNLMKQRSPISLIEGFKLFLKKNKEAKENSKLLLLGHAAYYKNKLIKEINHNIYWSQGNVPFEEVDVVQKNVSVNIILESKSEISPFLPGKFPHCISANKPILLLGPYYSESKRLLGNDYPYITEADEVEKISIKIEELYYSWKQNSDLKLNRPDLENYIGIFYLKEIIETLA